ncbi:MAG: CRISPR-associated CARF protein Csx1 [Candidatus Njordarchaeales archaeon]
MSTLLIAPWGCPAQWKDVIYSIDGRNIKSCTSLLPILKFLNEDVSVVIVVLDSLIDRYSGKGVESACYRYYSRYYNEFFRERVMDYNDLVGRCKEFIKSIVNDVAEEADVKIKDLEVIVGSCVGSPGGRWVFKGNANDFTALVLYELGKLCLERKYSRIILDLSHGVNFMPSVCLRIAYLLAGLLRIAYSESFEGKRDYILLEVYNSDPYPPGAKLPVLNINLVLKEHVKTAYIPHYISRRLIKGGTKISKDLERRIGEINSRYSDAVRTILSSLYYPLPLALCKAFKEYDMDALKGIVDEAINTWREHIRINYNQKQVIRYLRLSPEAIYNALLAYASYLNVKKSVESLGSIKVDDLKRLAELYRTVNESYYYLIKDEVSKIEMNIKTHKWEKDSVLYAELIGEFEEGRPPTKRPIKRVMIAHVGLQKEIVRVYKDRKMEYAFDVLGIKRMRDLLEEAGLLLTSGDE